MKYRVVIEKSETESEVQERIEEAIVVHSEGLKEAGEQIPLSSPNTILVDVKTA
jgi:predicted RNase H-like HicB family nuclease